MFANHDCARFFASEHSKNLRALAIEALAELHVRRDRLLPPVVFNVSVLSDVAHGIVSCVILSEAKNLGFFPITAWDESRKWNQRCFASLNMTRAVTLEIFPMHKVLRKRRPGLGVRGRGLAR